MKNILIAALLLLTATPALAETDWVLVGESDDGRTTAYVDRSSIRITGPIRRYWSRTDLASHQYGWKQIKELEEQNCASGQSRRLQFTVYKVDGTNFSPNVSNTWKYVTPDTVGSAVHDYVCGK